MFPFLRFNIFRSTGPLRASTAGRRKRARERERERSIGRNNGGFRTRFTRLLRTQAKRPQGRRQEPQPERRRTRQTSPGGLRRRPVARRRQNRASFSREPWCHRRRRKEMEVPRRTRLCDQNVFGCVRVGIDFLRPAAIPQANLQPCRQEHTRFDLPHHEVPPVVKFAICQNVPLHHR